MDLSQASAIYYGETGVSAVYLGSTQIWSNTPHDYSQDYFTIVSLEDNNIIGLKASNANLLKTISISTDGGTTWTNKESSTAGTTLATLNTGDKLLVKGSNIAYGNVNGYYNCFTSTGNFNIEGNSMSLTYADNFINKLTMSTYRFNYLFYNCDKLVSAKNFILPATTLRDYCYQYMFQGCISLTTAPELPATTLAGWCYRYMFNGCISLTTAPELPATTLTSGCYQYMFNGCTSLTTAPELPATTLTSGCYYHMFYGCKKLDYIKCLATDISAANCIVDWVNNVAASGTFVKNASMSSWTTGANGIPSGWSIVNA